jgi:hypothetical protein
MRVTGLFPGIPFCLGPEVGVVILPPIFPPRAKERFAEQNFVSEDGSSTNRLCPGKKATTTFQFLAYFMRFVL